MPSRIKKAIKSEQQIQMQSRSNKQLTFRKIMFGIHVRFNLFTPWFRSSVSNKSGVFFKFNFVDYFFAQDDFLLLVAVIVAGGI